FSFFVRDESRRPPVVAGLYPDLLRPAPFWDVELAAKLRTAPQLSLGPASYHRAVRLKLLDDVWVCDGSLETIVVTSAVLPKARYLLLLSVVIHDMILHLGLAAPDDIVDDVVWYRKY